MVSTGSASAPARFSVELLAVELHRLMLATQDGDRGACNRLMRRADPWLRRYFARRLPACDIDDAVQETLLAIYAQRQSFDGERPFLPWMVSIARYKWVDMLRGLRFMPLVSAEGPPTESHEGAVLAHRAVGRLLGQLPPAQAAALRLVKIEGLSVREASGRTGQSPALIKVNIHRALSRMHALCQ